MAYRQWFPEVRQNLLLCQGFYLQFIQLLVVDSGWCIEHGIAPAVVFGKSNKIPNTFTASQDGAKPVETECDTTVRGAHRIQKLPIEN